MDDADIDPIVAFLQTLTDEPYRGRIALANEHPSNTARSNEGMGRFSAASSRVP
jgi:hypothetical protein